MTQPARSLIAAGAMALLLASCIEAPGVHLTRVRVGGIGFQGATLIAELQVENRNRIALETDSVAFRMEARDPASGTWSEVAAGSHTERFRVEPRSEASVEIPIQLAYARLDTPVRSIIQSGRFNYRLSGDVYVRRPIPKRVPFAQDGSLALFESR